MWRGSELGEEAPGFDEVAVSICPECDCAAAGARIGMGALEDVAERRPARSGSLV
jgi:hypothetical protein